MPEDLLPAEKPPLKHRLACKLLELTTFLSFRSAWRLSGWLTYCFYPRSTKMKATIEHNLALAYPHQTDDQRAELARHTFRHTIAFGLEAGSVWLKPIDYGIAHIKSIEGLEYLEQAMESGKGVLILLPHLGNWEMANQFIAPRAQVVALYKPHPNKQLENHILNARTRAGVKMVPTSRSGVSQILRHLKKGGVTVVLPDQVPDGNGGVMAPFFKQEAATTTLVPKLARSSGSNVLSLVCARDTQGQFEIHLSPAPEAIASDDIALAAAAMNTYIESLVNHIPAQYQWSYKRFKSNQHLHPS